MIPEDIQEELNNTFDTRKENIMINKTVSGNTIIKKNWKTLFIPVLFSFSIALASCSDEGPMEKTGEKMDEAVEEAGDKIEEAGDEMKDAVEK